MHIYHEKRGSKRFRLMIPAVLYDRNFYRLPVRLVDISKTGLRVSDEILDIDQEVFIEWQGEEFRTRVVWTAGEQSGLRFEKDLDISHPLYRMAANSALN